jgi:hypothetical protein
MTFFLYCWGLFNNLPLILSDTNDVRDISITRVIAALFAYAALAMIRAAYFDHTLIPILAPLITPILVFLGGQLTLMAGKKVAVIMKGGNTQ